MSVKAKPFVPSSDVVTHRMTHNLKLEYLDDMEGPCEKNISCEDIVTNTDSGTRSLDERDEIIRRLNNEIATYKNNLEEQLKRTSILILQYKNDKVRINTIIMCAQLYVAVHVYVRVYVSDVSIIFKYSL